MREYDPFDFAPLTFIGFPCCSVERWRGPPSSALPAFDTSARNVWITYPPFVWLPALGLLGRMMGWYRSRYNFLLFVESVSPSSIGNRSRKPL